MADWRRRYMATTGHLLQGRQRAKLTQDQVAGRIGVSRRTFQRYESGELVPDAMQLFRWAGVVGVEIASNLTPAVGD